MTDEVVRTAEHGMRLEELDVESLRPNPWNPNEMNEDTFNRLGEELEDVGFIDPIQVVPMDDGTYQIIGGEHRWRAAKVFGYDTIPCVILDGEKWSDEDLRKFVTTRLNALKGAINPMKFMELYNDLASRHEEEALQALMGFTDKDAWRVLTKDVKTGLEDMGLSKEALKKFDEATAELKTVDDLAGILNTIFNEHGDDLTSNFMILSFGGRDHLYVQFDDAKAFKAVVKKVESIRGSGLLADQLIAQAVADIAMPSPIAKPEPEPAATEEAVA